MQDRTKSTARSGRPRQFDEDEAAARMQRLLWTTGLSGPSLDAIGRSAGLNRPSLAAAFGDKNAIYERAARDYAAMMDDRLRRALAADDLAVALHEAFEAVIDIYTAEGPDGCFVLCTAPAEARENPVCRDILDRSILAIDALFLDRLQGEQAREGSALADYAGLAAMLGATVHSIALRARAGWSRERLLQLAHDTVDRLTAISGERGAS